MPYVKEIFTLICPVCGKVFQGESRNNVLTEAVKHHLICGGKKP